MASSGSRSKTSRNPALEWVCENVLPNCEKAIGLAEAGTERALRPSERLALRYHGRLCPFCGCAEGKFTAAHDRYAAARAQRESAD